MQDELVQDSGPEAVDRLFNLFGKLRGKSDIPRFEDAEWRSQDHSVKCLLVGVSEGQLHSFFDRVVYLLDWLVQLYCETSFKDLNYLSHSMGQDIFGAFKQKVVGSSVLSTVVADISPVVLSPPVAHQELEELYLSLARVV